MTRWMSYKYKLAIAQNLSQTFFYSNDANSNIIEYSLKRNSLAFASLGNLKSTF